MKISSGKKSLFQVLLGGVGLFSDGYLNGVSGVLTTIMGNIYPVEYTTQRKSLLNSMIFLGNVIGMLAFGYMCDKSGRKMSLILASLFLVIFSILSSAAYFKGTNEGIIGSLIIYRFFLGIGIGGEYPAGSTTISEGAQEMEVKRKHSIFIFLTDFMICMGFVIAAFTAFYLTLIFTEKRQEAIWRVLLGIGAICPLILLIARLKMGEPEAYKNYAIKHAAIPYRLVIKKYYKRLFVISLVWFIYNFTAYSFGIYFSPLLQSISRDMSLSQIFGWTTFIYLSYVVGSFFGAFATDYFEPKDVLAFGVFMQFIFGFIIAGLYSKLKDTVVAFIIVYAFFMAFGEFGPGDNIGNISAKSSPTAIRGQFYGICAAFDVNLYTGKVGAFSGSYAFNYIIEKFGGPQSENGNRGPFFIGSSLALISGIISFFFIPKLSHDCIREENEHFKTWLQEQGYDITKMGLSLPNPIPDLNKDIANLESDTEKVDTEKIDYIENPQNLNDYEKNKQS
ncbi:hypothetical protein T552_04079 [Pneumocystis carinii B80]|uniref:Major facilitator superfamily (MFS) profile domain-containing protein n=1 Tax=Pneumocystis carinii (strain B80) TaxID=1408658 RepID=A0A0W4ZPC3_PNEC8|nr:hypothetical protein T552_04079 [Pneumocystis carinii B80]KTW30238.1 hypothetical protein T552_04079 [Pneumocystis carinii B80]